MIYDFFYYKILWVGFRIVRLWIWLDMDKQLDRNGKDRRDV